MENIAWLLCIILLSLLIVDTIYRIVTTIIDRKHLKEARKELDENMKKIEENFKRIAENDGE